MKLLLAVKLINMKQETAKNELDKISKKKASKSWIMKRKTKTAFGNRESLPGGLVSLIIFIIQIAVRRR